MGVIRTTETWDDPNQVLSHRQLPGSQPQPSDLLPPWPPGRAAMKGFSGSWWKNWYGCFRKIGVSPKWMVKIMENPIKNGWFGGTPIFGNTHLYNLEFPRPNKEWSFGGSTWRIPYCQSSKLDLGTSWNIYTRIYIYIIYIYTYQLGPKCLVTITWKHQS